MRISRLKCVAFSLPTLPLLFWLLYTHWPLLLHPNDADRPHIRAFRFPSDHNPSIFVAIASYRDDECHKTLVSLFQRAAFPGRIFVGLVQQNKPIEDLDCFAEYCKVAQPCWKEHIHVTRVHYLKAAGPTVARSLSEKLLNGTNYDFILQIDSHVHFIDSWDQVMIDEWFSIDNEMAILTHYPPAYEHDGASGTPPAICYKKIGDWGLPVSGYQAARWASSPILVNSWAAGFSFGKAHSVLRVPTDPHTPYLFHGEELVRAARLWTAGYDFYSPSKILLTHHYDRPKAHKYWQVDWARRYEIQQDSVARIKFLLGRPTERKVNITDIEHYGLGSLRTLDEYWKFSGIDWSQGAQMTFACSTLHLMPYSSSLFAPNGALRT